MRYAHEQLKKHPNAHMVAQLNPGLSTENNKIYAPDTSVVHFVVPGDPVPKPRMTQRDKWQKRPCVVKYRGYADRIRAAAPPLPVNPGSVKIIAHIAMTGSRKESKKQSMDEKPCRATRRHDVDNLAKSVLDSLFEDDSGIWQLHVEKYWCLPGDERTEIWVANTPF